MQQSGRTTVVDLSPSLFEDDREFWSSYDRDKQVISTGIIRITFTV